MASKTRDQENAATLLGHSEILSVEHAKASQIPALGKFCDDRLKVAASVGMEQRRNVFEHNPSGLNFVEDA